MQATGTEDAGSTGANGTATTATAHYRFVRPASFEEMVREAQATAYVEVLDVRADAELVPDSHASAGIPTTRVTVQTLETLAGNAPETFELFQLESPETDIEGSPAYEVGERYTVFARPRRDTDDGSWIIVGPDSRVRETSAGTFEPLIPGPIAEELSGDTKDEIDAAVNAVNQR